MQDWVFRLSSPPNTLSIFCPYLSTFMCDQNHSWGSKLSFLKVLNKQIYSFNLGMFKKYPKRNKLCSFFFVCWMNEKMCCIVSVIYIWNAYAIDRITDYGRPMKPFFIKIPNFRAWADNFGQINFGAFGIFLADLLAPILVLWVHVFK